MSGFGQLYGPFQMRNGQPGFQSAGSSQGCCSSSEAVNNHHRSVFRGAPSLPPGEPTPPGFVCRRGVLWPGEVLLARAGCCGCEGCVMPPPLPAGLIDAAVPCGLIRSGWRVGGRTGVSRRGHGDRPHRRVWLMSVATGGLSRRGWTPTLLQAELTLRAGGHRHVSALAF